MNDTFLRWLVNGADDYDKKTVYFFPLQKRKIR